MNITYAIMSIDDKLVYIDGLKSIDEAIVWQARAMYDHNDAHWSIVVLLNNAFSLSHNKSTRYIG